MKVINIHKRTINQSKEKVSELINTLATNNDLIWPYENWPAISFKNGVEIGSKGGHGRVRYTIVNLKAGEYIKFQFSQPIGFSGFHEFNVKAITESSTEIRHVIKAKLSFKASLLWVFVIRWLHDALIEDAFDKVENHFTEDKKKTKYNLWVNLLREVYKRKSFKIQHA